MSALSIRPAGPADARLIAELLSGVLASDDTSALQGPVETATIRKWMMSAPERSHWTVAEDAAGQLLGLQWIEPKSKLPREAADIATFVQPGRQQLGIGSALFTATVKAARRLGYVWINATIRADNEGGLVYYQSRGFRVWDRKKSVEIAPGKIIDQVCTRYDLD